jgi:tetratricopeptide (TPR) repeat protein
MPAASDVRAGGAFVELYAKSESFRNDLKWAEQRWQAFGMGMMKVGAGMVATGAGIGAALLAAAKHAADAGSELVDMSQRTGMSVESLSAFRYALGQSGATLEEFEVAVKKMQKTIAGDDAAETFGDIGLAIDELRLMDPHLQMLMLAEAIDRIEDPAQKTAAALEVFGKAGTKLLPLFNDGADGLQALMEKAERLGLVMSTEDAKAAEMFSDSLETITNIASRAVSIIGSSMIPVFQGLANWITENASAAAAWVNENRAMIVNIGIASAAAVAMGVAMIAMGAYISATATIISATAAVIKTAVLGMWLMVASTKAMVLAMAASPIIAFAIALRYVAGYILTLGDGIKKAKSIISDSLWAIVEDAKSAFGAIGAALARGDIAAAAAVAFAFLKLEWVRVTSALVSAWEVAISEIKSIWISMGATLAKIGISTVATIQLAWNGFNGFMAKVAAGMVGMFGWAFNKIGAMSDETLDELFDTLDREVNKRLADAENAKKEVNAARDQMLKDVNQQRDARQKDINDKLNEDLKKAADELAAAKERFNKAAEEAKKPAVGQPKAGGKAPGDPMAAVQKTSAAGTFEGGLAARMLGTGGVEQKQLVEQQKANRILERMARLLEKDEDVVFQA